jgi:glutathione S-transferase
MAATFPLFLLFAGCGLASPIVLLVIAYALWRPNWRRRGWQAALAAIGMAILAAAVALLLNHVLAGDRLTMAGLAYAAAAGFGGGAMAQWGGVKALAIVRKWRSVRPG